MATSEDRLTTYPEPGWSDGVNAWLRREIAEQGVPAEYLDREVIRELLKLIEVVYRQLHYKDAVIERLSQRLDIVSDPLH
jgi:hypothetical protein